MDRCYFHLIAPVTHTVLSYIAVFGSCSVCCIFRCVCSLIPVWLYVMCVFSCDKYISEGHSDSASKRAEMQRHFQRL